MTERRKIKPELALVEAPVREWRVLEDYPAYEISNDGRLRRHIGGSNTKAGAHIRCNQSEGNYPKYGLSLPDGRRVYRAVHRLVAFAFFPPPEPGKTKVLHADDNKLNCVDTNLRWGTTSENHYDARRNGRIRLGADHPSAARPWTRPRGATHSAAKLADADVLAILADTRMQKVIAAEYGVDPALIYRIKARKVWKHLTRPGYQAMLQSGAENDA